MGDEITQKVEEKSKLTSKGIAIGIAIVILLLSSALGGAIGYLLLSHLIILSRELKTLQPVGLYSKEY